MKRAIGFAVLLATLVATAASAAGADKPGEGVTLHLMHIQMEPTRSAVERAVKRFEQQTGARVVSEAVKSEQYKGKLAVTLPSNSPPDVFHTWGGGVLGGYVNDGLVAPVPADFPVQGIRPEPLRFCTIEGRLYAVPADLSIVAFWYNRTAFEKHRVTPPATFDDFLRVCDSLKAAGVTPVAFANLEHWEGAFYFDYLVLRQGGAADYVRESNAAGGLARTPAAVRAEQMIRDLAGRGVFSEGYAGMTYDQAQTVFFKGDAPIILMGSWLLSYAIDRKPEMVPEMGLFPFPLVSGGADPSALIGGVNAAYAVSAKCPHPELAFQLLRFLTDETAANDWLTTGRIPARAVPVSGVPAVLADAIRLLDRADRVQLYFDQALAPAVAEKHKAYTQKSFAGAGGSTAYRIVIGALCLAVLAVAVLVLWRVFRGAGGR